VYAVFFAITADVSMSNYNEDINFVCVGPAGGLLTLIVFYD